MRTVYGEFIVPHHGVLKKLKKEGCITVSAYNTFWGERRYTKPCNPDRKPQSKNVLYRVHVRLK